MRALGELDAFPSSDLGLLRAMTLESSRELERRAEAWRPWRAYAAMYLWRIVGQSAAHGKDLVLSKAKKGTVGRAFSQQQAMAG
jgi:3-methyladenine DNA glycosylase/8-oxoguanine DNA glycosylase